MVEFAQPHQDEGRAEHRRSEGAGAEVAKRDERRGARRPRRPDAVHEIWRGIAFVVACCTATTKAMPRHAPLNDCDQPKMRSACPARLTASSNCAMKSLPDRILKRSAAP